MKMKSEELDKLFDSGGDMTPYMDMSTLKTITPSSKRVNVDFPAWMVTALDREAQRIGVTRQSLIKLWLADKLQH